jgi:hypothetical protein
MGGCVQEEKKSYSSLGDGLRKCELLRQVAAYQG